MTAFTNYIDVAKGDADSVVLEVANLLNRMTKVTSHTTATLSAATLQASYIHSTVKLDRAAGIAVTLPAATGSGDRYTFIIGTTFTSSATIKVTGNDVMFGHALYAADAGDTAVMFETAADSDTITFDGTTTGGYKGTIVRLIDMAADSWFVEVIGKATGAEATPFSATV